VINSGLQLYLLEAEKHQEKYLSELEELRIDLIAGQFKSRDYRATERLLQILTELSIGLAKHWLKDLQGHSAAEAYQTFSQLTEHGQLTSSELSNWKKIIGMRNGLVHDYLNIDLLIVEKIIKNKQYIQLAEFNKKALQALREN